MRSFIQKGLALSLALLISLFGIFAPLQTLAATEVTLTAAAEKTSYEGGQRAKVEVSVSAVTAAGFYAKLKFDGDTLSLTGVTVNEEIFSGMTYGISDGECIFSWSAGENRTIPQGTVAVLTFAIPDGAPAKEYELEWTAAEWFDEALAPVACTGVNGTVKVAEKTVSAAAQKVIALINEIGPVTDGSIATGKKIDAAMDGFLALSAKDKKAVSNYEALSEANRKYQLLREEQNAQDNAAALQAILDKFRADYAKELALTPETVQIIHLAGVNEALADYAQQSAYIRKKLEQEQTLLLELKAEIQKMADAADAQAAASAMAESFRENFAALIELPVDGVILDPSFKSELETALSTYEDVFPELAQEMVKTEYTHILEIYNRYLALEAENAGEPEEVINAYNDFRAKWRRLLLMSEQEVLAEDAELIDQALAEYNGLDNTVKGKLSAEFEHLLNLLFALELAEAEPEPEKPPVEPTEEPTEAPTVPQPTAPNGGNTTIIKPGPGNIDISVGASLSPRVIQLFWVLLAAGILLVVSVVSYILIRKKKGKEGQDEE